MRVPRLPEPVTLSGPWSVAFESPAARPQARNIVQLESWTKSEDPLLKYFSGTATYTKDVEIAAAMLGTGKRLLLDLGAVGEIAEVRLNGKELGIRWTSPFLVDLTAAARPGRNHLEVRVTNFWVNRVAGDAQLPADRRTTRTNITALTNDSQLLPSGLMGPVVLRPAASVAVR